MNTVTQFPSQRINPTDHGQVTLSQSRNLTPIEFKAYERPLFYTGSNIDHQYHDTSHKALVRIMNDKPVCLGVVRNTYNMIQNGELFDEINRGFSKYVEADHMNKAIIKDKASYNGAVCFREYIFPTIRVASPERDEIAFRVVVQNGFGTGAIKLYAGAIDFFCTNGLILGNYTSVYSKHTKGVQLKDFGNAVAAALDTFWVNKDMYADLSKKRVLSDKDVSDWLLHHFGERLGKRLYAQYLREVSVRGRTLWAVYSALTYYASHNDGEFGTRNTINDHEASTMVKRQVEVQSVIGKNESNLLLLAA